MWTTEPQRTWGSKLCNRLLQSFLLRSTFLAKKATGIAFVIVASRWSASSNTDFHATKWFETTTNLKQSPAKFSASPPFLLNFSAQPASNLRALWRNCALCIVLKAAATATQTSELKTQQYNAHWQFGKLNPSQSSWSNGIERWKPITYGRVCNKCSCSSMSWSPHLKLILQFLWGLSHGADPAETWQMTDHFTTGIPHQLTVS